MKRLLQRFLRVWRRRALPPSTRLLTEMSFPAPWHAHVRDLTPDEVADHIHRANNGPERDPRDSWLYSRHRPTSGRWL